MVKPAASTRRLYLIKFQSTKDRHKDNKDYQVLELDMLSFSSD